MLCTENLRNEPTTTSTIVFRISRKNVTFRQIVFTAPLSPYPVWEGLCVFAREHFIFFLYFLHSFIRKHAHKLSIFHLSLSVLPLPLMQDFSAHKYVSILELCVSMALSCLSLWDGLHWMTMLWWCSRLWIVIVIVIANCEVQLTQIEITACFCCCCCFC